MPAGSKDANEFVLGSVERALASIRLVPDRQVQQSIVELAPDIDQIADVAPIHANKVDRSFGRHLYAVAKRFAKKSSDLRRGALARSECEFWMPIFSTPTDRPYPNIVRRIAEDGCSRDPVHKPDETVGL